MPKHPEGYNNASDLLLEMAAGEESTRPEGYCRIGRGNESELCYDLYKAGLLVESQSQGFVTWLSDRGRVRAVEVRRQRGWVEHRLFCESCGHGVLAHRGDHTTWGDVALSEGLEYDRDYKLKDGRGIWELHGHCLGDGCSCTHCAIPWPEEASSLPEVVHA